MRQVAILGVGMTKFGISEKTNLEMFAEAGLDAITQSNVEPKDIEALYFGNCLGGFEEGQLHMDPFAHVELGLPLSAPATRFESACATATVAIRHAALLVAAGFYDVVELHDCFTIAEILALESFGLYEFGKAYDAATKRDTYVKGKVVVNPSGGLKAKGHPNYLYVAKNVISRMPDSASIDGIMYRLYVIDKVRKGREAGQDDKTGRHYDKVKILFT
jgi:acetyl-CoA acetyltransferase